MYLIKHDKYFIPSEDEAVQLHASLADGEVIAVSVKRAPSRADLDDYGYYYAGLLPQIADAMGEHNRDKVHLLLKRDFLYTAISNVEQINKRYFLGVRPTIMDYNTLYNLADNYIIPFSMLRMHVIIIYKNIICDNEIKDRQICGYIPSLSTLNKDEMKKFVRVNVSKRLYVDLQSK